MAPGALAFIDNPSCQ